MKQIPIHDFIIGAEDLVSISGPCVIENEMHTLKAAEELKKIHHQAGVRLVFKSSYDKANRSSLSSYRGPGLEKGLRILERVKRELDLPVCTDVHSPEEAIAAGEVCDIVQIPAFLCRQTDLLVAAAKSQGIVSIKKGQFMAPWDMGNAVEKVRQSGNSKVILVDRGASFGYNNLVSDMRSIPVMQKFDVPVCFDATHSVQLPGGHGTSSGGQREFIPVLAKAALAAGADLIFMESHPNPSEALSDKDSVLPFSELSKLLSKLKGIYELIRMD